MAKTREQILIDRYGFNHSSYKWVLPGSVILEYIGQPVMCLNFTKDDKDNWNVTNKAAIIEDICNFNPLTMTYKCYYRLEGSEETKVIDIIPEGFSFGNPEETKNMIRFIPYSLHCEMTERELFLSRIKNLMETRPTISIESIKALQESKEQDKTLKYCCNFGMAVELNDGNILWIRIHKANIHHKAGTTYSLRLVNDEDTWNLLIDSKSSEYDFEDGLGKFKLIDLRTDDKPEEKESNN